MIISSKKSSTRNGLIFPGVFPMEFYSIFNDSVNCFTVCTIVCKWRKKCKKKIINNTWKVRFSFYWLISLPLVGRSNDTISKFSTVTGSNCRHAFPISQWLHTVNYLYYETWQLFARIVFIQTRLVEMKKTKTTGS